MRANRIELDHGKAVTADSMDGVEKQLRFKVGDRIIANTEDGTEAGVIIALHYRVHGWPKEIVAPYQIQLDDGTLIFAPADSPVTNALVHTIRSRACMLTEHC